MNELKNILKWIFGIALLFFGLIALFASPFLTGLFFLIAGVLLFPPTVKIIEERTNKQFPQKQKYIAIIVAIFLGLAFIPQNNKPNEKNETSNINEIKNDTNQKIKEEVIAEQEELETVTSFGKAGYSVYDANGNKLTPKTTYEIIEQSDFAGIKYTYEIRLSNDKLTKEEIAKLAMVLKDKLDKDYERIFICYYLPGVEIGSGAWATSHFDKDLKVRILNLDTNEDLDNIQIGKWRARDAYRNNFFVSIFKKDNKIYFEKLDGTDDVDNFIKEMTIKTVSNEKRYVINEDNTDLYYVINRFGDLEIYNKKGLIREYTKITDE